MGLPAAGPRSRRPTASGPSFQPVDAEPAVGLRQGLRRRRHHPVQADELPRQDAPARHGEHRGGRLQRPERGGARPVGSRRAAACRLTIQIVLTTSSGESGGTLEMSPEQARLLVNGQVSAADYFVKNVEPVSDEGAAVLRTTTPAGFRSYPLRRLSSILARQPGLVARARSSRRLPGRRCSPSLMAFAFLGIVLLPAGLRPDGPGPRHPPRDAPAPREAAAAGPQAADPGAHAGSAHRPALCERRGAAGPRARGPREEARERKEIKRRIRNWQADHLRA